MKLNELFLRDIKRNINGVIKVEQVDDTDVVYQELEEFVITRELHKHFEDFYSSYNKSLDGSTDKVGVWISGFFGSGKSHFLKMLSYLLENKQIRDKKAVEFFENKVEDKILYSDILRASTFPTDAILFNIDSKSNSDGKTKKNAIVDVFLKVFNEKLGYCAQIPWLADIERILDEEGHFERFKAEYKAVASETWEEGRDKAYFVRDDFVTALKATKGISQESAEQLFDKAENNYGISPETFASLVKKYLDKKGNKHRIIFLVDEVGQYIGSNTDLMLNLQTIVENLGTTCKGKAWILVTSQEAVDTLSKERFKDLDFSKIQGRFPTRLNLSSSNTDEVIKKRLLDKKPQAEKSLTAHYEHEEAILRNLITFSANTAGMRSFNSNEDFIQTYPFVPYQFNLLQKVFESIRKFSHAGKHLSEGERSMLNAFHTSLINYADKDITDLVPFNAFYSTVETFLDGSIKRIFDRAQIDFADIEDFDVEVLKVLFMIKYIKEVPADLENIATLMISNMNQSKNELKAKIESSLTRLKKATLIQQNGDRYDFLTDEEQDVNRGIKQMQIDYRNIINNVYDVIFREIYTKTAYSYGKNNYYVSRWVDDICQGKKGEDLEIKFITSQSSMYNFDETRYKLATAEGSVLLIKLPSDNIYLSEIENVIKTQKYINQKSDIKMSDNQRKIVAAKGDEIIQRKARIEELIAEAIIKSEFYASSEKLDIDGTDPVTIINKGLDILVKNTFHKLPMIKMNIQTERDIANILNNPQQTLTEGNKQAETELFSFISQRSEMNLSTTMQELKIRFTKKPYGWASIDIAGVLASLFRQNEIILNYNGSKLSVNDKNIPRYLTNERELTNILIKVKTQIDSTLIDKARNLARELFETQTLDEDGEKLVSQIKNELIPALISEIQELQIKYKPYYPDKFLLNESKDLLKSLTSVADAVEFLEKFIAKSEELKTWKNRYKYLKSFFTGSQVAIFEDSYNVYRIIKENISYLSDDARSLLNELNSILTEETPYSKIKDLPELCDRCKDINTQEEEKYMIEAENDYNKSISFLIKEINAYGLDPSAYIAQMKPIENTIKHPKGIANIIAAQQNIKTMEEKLLQAAIQDHAKANVKTGDDTPINTDNEEPSAGTRQVQVRVLEYINPATLVEVKSVLETEEDVDDYINKLSAELKKKIRSNKRIKLQ